MTTFGKIAMVLVLVSSLVTGATTATAGLRPPFKHVEYDEKCRAYDMSNDAYLALAATLAVVGYIRDGVQANCADPANVEHEVRGTVVGGFFRAFARVVVDADHHFPNGDVSDAEAFHLFKEVLAAWMQTSGCQLEPGGKAYATYGRQVVEDVGSAAIWASEAHEGDLLDLDNCRESQ